MSDKDFVDVGDELVVRISGYPVGRARVVGVDAEYITVVAKDDFGEECRFSLPLNVKEYDTVDGVAHEVKPSPCEHGKRFCQECHGDNFLDTAPVDGMGQAIAEAEQRRAIRDGHAGNGDTWENEGGAVT